MVLDPVIFSEEIKKLSATGHDLTKNLPEHFRNVPEGASLQPMSDPSNGNDARTTRVTIREIAELAGVSIATVSRVVNGRGDVSDETRELVQQVI